jgi:hypothetical protein
VRVVPLGPVPQLWSGAVRRVRVVCPCSRESDCVTDEQRRKGGWRLAPASSEPPLPAGDVFVWICPDCAANRFALLRAS